MKLFLIWLLLSIKLSAVPNLFNAKNELNMLKLYSEHGEEAFKTFYDYYSPALYGVIIKITGNTPAAYKAMKNTFKEIWLTESTSNKKSHIFLWMLSIARRCALEERYPKNRVQH